MRKLGHVGCAKPVRRRQVEHLAVDAAAGGTVDAPVGAMPDAAIADQGTAGGEQAFDSVRFVQPLNRLTSTADRWDGQAVPTNSPSDP
jgi:hypothetical protein